MKHLILIRHAKSSWKGSTLDDRERPLNRRGERDAPEMGVRLARRNVKPELIVSSPALRALETARIIAKSLGYARNEIVVKERLYGAGVVELLDVIRNADESVATLMLFGHNPGLTELANHLGPRPIPNLPTCGVLHLKFEADVWPVVGYARGDEVLFDFPKS
ncbi:MAG: histidine phosphatase family protein [Deltaproteobacteria bacterium]|nr:histidine phosphatase family protein [Deltaproteobacteria bacterium]